jgi:hypothetical protein
MGEYRVGDRFVTATLFAGVANGAEAFVFDCGEGCREKGKACCVRLPKHDREWHLFYEDAERVLLPTPPPAEPRHAAPGPRVGHITREEHRLAIANREHDIAALRAELEQVRKQHVEVLGAKTNYGDVCGERDRYRRESHELATRVAWLERELLRAKGGRR